MLPAAHQARRKLRNLVTFPAQALNWGDSRARPANAETPSRMVGPPMVEPNPLDLSSEDRQILETWEELFAQTWTEGRLAQLYPTLPPEGNPLRLHLLIRLIRNDMTFRCQRGRRAQVEEYLKKYPELFAVPSVP